METAKIVTLALALAFMAESSVEYVLGTPFKKFPKLQELSWLLMYVSLGVGIGLAFLYSLDLLALITGETATVQGITLSGLAIGRGAQYLHDFVSRYVLKA